MGHLDTNNFYFLFLLFFGFYFTLLLFYFIFFGKMMKKAHDKEVTWCDVIGLEHGGRI